MVSLNEWLEREGVGTCTEEEYLAEQIPSVELCNDEDVLAKDPEPEFEVVKEEQNEDGIGAIEILLICGIILMIPVIIYVLPFVVIFLIVWGISRFLFNTGIDAAASGLSGGSMFDTKRKKRN